MRVFWWEGVGTLENYWWGLHTYLSFPGLLTQSHILNKPRRCIAKGNGRNITAALKIWIFTDLQLHPSQGCLGSKSRNCLNKEKYVHSVTTSPPLWGCSSLDLSFLILALALCCHLSSQCYCPGPLDSLINRNWQEARWEFPRFYRGSYRSSREQRQESGVRAHLLLHKELPGSLDGVMVGTDLQSRQGAWLRWSVHPPWQCHMHELCSFLLSALALQNGRLPTTTTRKGV